MEQNNSRNLRKAGDAMKEFGLEFKDQIANRSLSRELEIGFEDFDFFSGLEGGEIAVIAGWPSMGKTSFALSIVRNICIGQKLPVLYLSPAICSLGVLKRLVASHCKIGLSRIRSGHLTEIEQTRFDAGVEDLAKSPLYIDDNPISDLEDLCNSCREAVKQHKIRIAIIDNLQMIPCEIWAYRPHREGIAGIMQSLKRLARELDIPIVVVSQTINTLFKANPIFKSMPRHDETGIMGAVEEISDKVFFVYRPEEYGIMEDDQGRDMRYMANIMLVKNNTSATTNVRLKFDGMYGRFQELDEPLASQEDW